MRELIECALCGKDQDKAKSHCTDDDYRKDLIGDPSAEFFCSKKCFDQAVLFD